MGERFGSLCTGYGGLDLAVGGELVWVSESDKHAAAVIDAHHDVPNVGDLTEVDWSQVDPVDILTAGYPCQPFSIAGRQLGDQDERYLWPHIADAISVLRPRRVVLENVAGHLVLGGPAVVGDLARLGYDCRWGVVRASDTGAPHRRARWFCVARNADRVGESPLPGEGAGSIAKPSRVGEDATDTDRRPAGRDGRAVPRTLAEGGWAGAAVCSSEPVDRATIWGEYTTTVARWEHIIGRPAPDPTDDRGRLNPPFVEWMMGLPAGWVCDVLDTRTHALRVLGNGVVPQQARLALQLLTPDQEGTDG